MAQFNCYDLKEWRKKQGISAQDLADSLYCDVSMIYRYERGEFNLPPDTVYRICHILGDETRWYDWMWSHYESYRKMHPEAPGACLSEIILELFSIVESLNGIRGDVFHDAADGTIDSKVNQKQLTEAAGKLLVTARKLRDQMNGKGGGIP